MVNQGVQCVVSVYCIVELKKLYNTGLLFIHTACVSCLLFMSMQQA